MVVTIHIVGFLALFISLLAVAPKNSAAFVWATFENNSGWPNDGLAWLLGMLTSCYVFIGYDCAAHMRSPHFSSFPFPLVPRQFYRINRISTVRSDMK